MTLNSQKMTISVTDSEGMVHVFTDAHGVLALSQDMDNWVSYISYREFAKGQTFSASIRDDITDALKHGKAVHA